MLKMDVTYTDEDGNLILPVEDKYETNFMKILHTSSTYEEFMMKADIENSEFDESYFGFTHKDELWQFVKDYYASKKGFLQYGMETKEEA